MNAYAQAGIELDGTVLRYAEVEHYATNYRLLRLGSCDFDFDVAEQLLRAEDPEHLETIAMALGDVFRGSLAQHFNIVLHPPSCQSFSAPVLSGSPADKLEAHLLHEAELLTATDTQHALHITTTRLYTQPLSAERELDWFHVLVLPEERAARFKEITGPLAYADYHLALSTQAAAAVVRRIEHKTLPPRQRTDQPYTLAIGQYTSHLEYTLCYNGEWRHSHHTRAGTALDAAFFATTLLNHLHLSTSAIGRIFIYGTPDPLEAFAPYSDLFGVVPEVLNPIAAVDLDPASLDESFAATAYVPCIGTAL